MTVKVWFPIMISSASIKEMPGNSQKQTKHEFSELRKSIREEGFDESLLVVPSGDGYEVVSGNHRFRAGKAEGMSEFPCVVRDDWDEVQSVIQSVRRNYVRGKINKDAFTEQVNDLSTTHSLPIDTIYEEMGFEDPDAFAKYYQEEQQQQQAVMEATITPPAVRILEDLGSVISTIFAEHGHTVPNSFIIFPTGGKHHLYVASTPALKNGLEALVEYCVSQDIDINIALGGLLAIGLNASDFYSKVEGIQEVVAEGTSPGDSDILPVKRSDEEG